MTDWGQRIVFLHAHPDDETLATGVLLAELAAAGRQVSVVTATRGEMGAVMPGPLAALEGTPELVAHRLGELAGALAELGVTEHVFLGAPPGLIFGFLPCAFRCLAGFFLGIAPRLLFCRLPGLFLRLLP